MKSLGKHILGYPYIYRPIHLLNHKWHTAHVHNPSRLQVIRNTAHRSSTQASYTIGLGTIMQENQPAAQIAARHNIFPQMKPYMSCIFLVLVGFDPRVSRLGGEIVTVSHHGCAIVWHCTYISWCELWQNSWCAIPHHTSCTSVRLEITVDVHRLIWKYTVTVIQSTVNHGLHKSMRSFLAQTAHRSCVPLDWTIWPVIRANFQRNMVTD